jgi:hypothetical protein
MTRGQLEAILLRDGARTDTDGAADRRALLALVRELAEAEQDALRWWRYVDPFDIYPEDEEAWRKWQRISEERKP